MKALVLGFLFSDDSFFGHIISLILHSAGCEELLCYLLELLLSYNILSPSKQEFYFLLYFLTTHIELFLVLVDVLLKFRSNSQVCLAS